MAKQSLNKPNTKDLRDILKGVIVADDTRRLQAFVKALQWYDVAVPYVVARHKGSLPLESVKDLGIANKCRERGISTTFIPEKETSYKMALKKYERVCAELNPPSVEKYYETFLSTKTKLYADDARLQDKYGYVTMILNDTLRSGLQLRIGKGDKARSSNGKDTILYSKEHALAMRTKLKREGVLSLVLQEAPHIARALSYEQDGIGGFSYNAKKHVEHIQILLNNFLIWSKSEVAPKRLVKLGTTSTKSPTKERKTYERKGGPGRHSDAPKGSLEFYRKGSCIRILADKLSTGNEFQISDLVKNLGFGNPMPALERIERHGEKYGNWKIHRTETTVKMDVKGKK